MFSHSIINRTVCLGCSRGSSSAHRSSIHTVPTRPDPTLFLHQINLNASFDKISHVAHSLHTEEIEKAQRDKEKEKKKRSKIKKREKDEKDAEEAAQAAVTRLEQKASASEEAIRRRASKPTIYHLSKRIPPLFYLPCPWAVHRSNQSFAPLLYYQWHRNQLEYVHNVRKVCSVSSRSTSLIDAVVPLLVCCSWEDC